MDTILSIKGITKHFPGVKALDDVSIDVYRGEVHAIVGENGAGKSTLMKILGGLYPADSGSISINGKLVSIRSVQDSIANGISVIYQEFNLVPLLTVAENIFMTRLPGKSGIVNRRQLNQRCAALMQELDLNIPPNRFVSELAVAQRQMVEIVKATSHDAQIVIMDEPTASLNDKEVETLYRLIATLKARGTTILYISHRMKEIFDVSDRITVLRDGRMIETMTAADTCEEALIRKMVGRDVSHFFHDGAAAAQVGETKLRVEGLTKKGLYSDISFELRKGEILGLAGLMGCHREEIARTLFGLIHPDSGKIYLDGQAVTINSPVDAIHKKIVLSTDDRKNEGIFPDLSVKDNMAISILEQLCRKGNGLIDRKKEAAIVHKYTQYMEIKFASAQQHMMHLSGGNQQKVLLARALATGCEVLILMEPTRGIDVGAKSEIYRMLKELAAQGIAILMVTSETQELISLCHRALVIFQGKVGGELRAGDANGADITEDNIMFCSTGNQQIFYRGASQCGS